MVGVAVGHATGLSSNPLGRTFIAKKILFTSETRLHEFSKPGEDFLLLVKLWGRSYLHLLSFLSLNWAVRPIQR